jgi:hypothetical protein
MSDESESSQRLSVFFVIRFQSVVDRELFGQERAHRYVDQASDYG